MRRGGCRGKLACIPAPQFRKLRIRPERCESRSPHWGGPDPCRRVSCCIAALCAATDRTSCTWSAAKGQGIPGLNRVAFGVDTLEYAESLPPGRRSESPRSAAGLNTPSSELNLWLHPAHNPPDGWAPHRQASAGSVVFSKYAGDWCALSWLPSVGRRWVASLHCPACPPRDSTTSCASIWRNSGPGDCSPR